MTIKEVVAALERFAPLPLQEGYDNAGLQIGLTEGEEVSGVLLCLDVTEAVIDEAVAHGCNLVVAHHPLLFRGIKRIDDATQVTRCVHRAIRAGVAVYAAHTNLDNALGGVNHRLAQALGLTPIRPLMPLDEAGNGGGLLAECPIPMAPADMLRHIASVLGCPSLRYTQGPDRPIRRVALCGGAGESLLDAAIASGADLFLTGEMGYHRFFGHKQRLWLAVAGHYETEQFTPALMADLLRDACPGLTLHVVQTCTNPVRYLM